MPNFDNRLTFVAVNFCDTQNCSDVPYSYCMSIPGSYVCVCVTCSGIIAISLIRVPLFTLLGPGCVVFNEGCASDSISLENQTLQLTGNISIRGSLNLNQSSVELNNGNLDVDDTFVTGSTVIVQNSTVSSSGTNSDFCVCEFGVF